MLHLAIDSAYNDNTRLSEKIAFTNICASEQQN